VIAWREKWRAFALHFLLTLVVTAGAAALVFLFWFPAPFPRMLGGMKLFNILVLCGLGLGPLTSFIIFSSAKSRRALLFDYVVVGTLQLAAFVYGLYVLANTRPVYLVFAGDRLEVVTAAEIDDADLARAAEPYRQRPRWGPQLVGIQEPVDRKEREQVLFSALAGKDYSVLPAYYTRYENNLELIRKRSLPLGALEQRHPEARALLASATAQLQTPTEKLVWLPVKHRRGFWTALLDPVTGRPIQWLPLDPY
jgi:hypothetical protein